MMCAFMFKRGTGEGDLMSPGDTRSKHTTGIGKCTVQATTLVVYWNTSLSREVLTLLFTVATAIMISCFNNLVVVA